MDWISLVCILAFAGYVLRKKFADKQNSVQTEGREQPGSSITTVLTDDDRRVENEFRNVFAIMSAERREQLLSSYLKRRRCSRSEAMRLALIDRQKDADRAF